MYPASAIVQGLSILEVALIQSFYLARWIGSFYGGWGGHLIVGSSVCMWCCVFLKQETLLTLLQSSC